MAKLHFFYSVMNSGKSSHLLQARFNYLQLGTNVMLVTSAIDDRAGVGVVSSRIGLSADAYPLTSSDDLFELTKRQHAETPLGALMMDEVQFMTPDHIRQAARVVDELDIPVMAYGLKNNVFSELFSDAVATILAYADNINEIRQVCHCGRKATMILRYGPDGIAEKTGSVIEIGAESRYISVCRKHWVLGDIGAACRSRLDTPSPAIINALLPEGVSHH